MFPLRLMELQKERKKRIIGRTSTSTAKTKKLDDFQDLIQMELLKKIEFQLIEKM